MFLVCIFLGFFFFFLLLGRFFPWFLGVLTWGRFAFPPRHRLTATVPAGAWQLGFAVQVSFQAAVQVLVEADGLLGGGSFGGFWWFFNGFFSVFWWFFSGFVVFFCGFWWFLVVF